MQEYTDSTAELRQHLLECCGEECLQQPDQFEGIAQKVSTRPHVALDAAPCLGAEGLTNQHKQMWQGGRLGQAALTIQHILLQNWSAGARILGLSLSV